MWKSEYLWLDEAVEIVQRRTGKDGWRLIQSAWLEGALSIKVLEDQGYALGQKWRSASSLEGIAFAPNFDGLRADTEVRLLRVAIDQLWPTPDLSSPAVTEDRKETTVANRGGYPGKSFETEFWCEVISRIYSGDFDPRPYDDQKERKFRELMAQWISDRGYKASRDDWVKPRTVALFARLLSQDSTEK